jgi:hypothetical protein
MRDEERKARYINFLPPMPLKQKIDLYGRGNRTAFIIEAVKEKIAKMETESLNANKVSRLL